jgi:hypothetical protein
LLVTIFRLAHARYVAHRRCYEIIIAASDSFARYDFAAHISSPARARARCQRIFAARVTLKNGHESYRAVNDLTGKRGGGQETREWPAFLPAIVIENISAAGRDL